jgi:uncharacterized membrane protein (GlpM family)
MNAFVLKLILSFFVGSVWITLGTVIAEKYGTRIGGLVTGFPSTILISLFFIGWTQNAGIAAEATAIVPIIGGITCLFTLMYILLLRVNFGLALAAALLVWLGLSGGLVLLKFRNFGLSLPAYFGLLLASYYLIDKGLKIKSVRGKHIRHTLPMMFFRGLFGGLIISLAVVLAKIGGPLLGGVFAMFPAMFIGILAITYFSEGAAFSAAVMKSSLVGAVSVVVYGVAVRFTYVPFGLWWGTLISLLVALGSTFFIHRSIEKKIS